MGPPQYGADSNCVRLPCFKTVPQVTLSCVPECTSEGTFSFSIQHALVACDVMGAQSVDHVIHLMHITSSGDPSLTQLALRRHRKLQLSPHCFSVVPSLRWTAGCQRATLSVLSEVQHILQELSAGSAITAIMAKWCAIPEGVTP